MIALFDFQPSFCPHCGTAITMHTYARDDYHNNHCSFGCLNSCGLDYQKADTNLLLTAAKESGGDLARYVHA